VEAQLVVHGARNAARPEFEPEESTNPAREHDRWSVDGDRLSLLRHLEDLENGACITGEDVRLAAELFSAGGGELVILGLAVVF